MCSIRCRKPNVSICALMDGFHPQRYAWNPKRAILRCLKFSGRWKSRPCSCAGFFVFAYIAANFKRPNPWSFSAVSSACSRTCQSDQRLESCPMPFQFFTINHLGAPIDLQGTISPKDCQLTILRLISDCSSSIGKRKSAVDSLSVERTNPSSALSNMFLRQARDSHFPSWASQI
jgi:hypothetical protein